jgi:hypothetical protein
MNGFFGKNSAGQEAAILADQRRACNPAPSRNFGQRARRDQAGLIALYGRAIFDAQHDGPVAASLSGVVDQDPVIAGPFRSIERPARSLL